AGMAASEDIRPFAMRDPAIDRFPAKLWGSLAAKRARTLKSWLQIQDDGCGYRPLREAIAHYLAVSRGVRCSAEQILLVSGNQQALDLIARVLLSPASPYGWRTRATSGPASRSLPLQRESSPCRSTSTAWMSAPVSGSAGERGELTSLRPTSFRWA